MDALNEDQIGSVIANLRDLTESSILEWNAPNSDVGPAFSFSSIVDKHGYVIESTDQDDQAPFRLGIYLFDVPNRNPIRQTRPFLIQEVKSDDLDYSLSEPLRELYESVKRRTMRLENVASEILGGLEALKRRPGGARRR